MTGTGDRADLIALGRERLGIEGDDDHVENVLVALKRQGKLILDLDENGKLYLGIAGSDGAD